MDPATHNTRRKQKSRSGCINCKRRRLKCDESVPQCQRCVKSGVPCPGYTRPVKWSTKYEKSVAPRETSEASVSSIHEDFSWFDQEAKKLTGLIASRQATEQPGNVSQRDAFEPGASPDSSGYRSSSQDSLSLQEGIHSPGILFPASPSTSRNSADAEESDVDLAPSRSNVPQLENAREYTLSRYVPTEQISILQGHYYSLVCRINSSFDSSRNPFRSHLSDFMRKSPLIFYSVMAMSAAHLYQYDKDASVTLEFQARAISQLSKDLEEACSVPTETSGEGNAQLQNGVKDDLLLGIILLGITSAWNDVSAIGQHHLTGSRALFTSWIAANGLNKPPSIAAMTDSQRFLVSSMVFWEAVSSFVVDQKTEALSHLDLFLNESILKPIQPHPWCGIATPAFIYLAKLGTLMRKQRILRKLHLFENGELHYNVLFSELVEEARALEQSVLTWQIPPLSLIGETGDPNAPPDHFYGLARCYRLATLLELYRTFPALIDASSEIRPSNIGFGTCHEEQHSQLVLRLAIEILSILKTVLKNSSTISSQSLALIIAGSTLGPVKQSQENHSGSHTNQKIIEWRNFARERGTELQKMIGLRSVKNGIIMVQESWNRMDALAEPGRGGMGEEDVIFSERVHWMTIMTEMNLQTILG